MLNNFGNTICPLCGLSLVQYSFRNRDRFVCGKIPINEIDYHGNHYTTGAFVEDKVVIQFEEIFIEQHCLVFYSDGFEYIYYENKKFNPEHLITLKGCTITFAELDSVDKIENFVRNYKLLC